MKEETMKKFKLSAIITPVAAIITAAAVLLSGCGNQSNDDKDKNDSEETGTHEKADYNDIKDYKSANVGDFITFGSYEQDNDTSNGKEEIEWRVLAKENNRILVISEYGLDCQPYDTSNLEVTWETCSLRKWLNGTFMNNAFSSEEQAKIQSTTVTADANPEYSTDPGNDTTDKVFLLSFIETEEYFSSVEDRKCVPTAYAIAQGIYADSDYTKGGKATCRWWLRSPGYDSFLAADVAYDGSVDYYGCGVGIDLYLDIRAVRPALWLTIE